MNFIYTPKSGSRVFASKESKYVFTVRYTNGSYHVLGGVKIQFITCLPGKSYWREAAKVMAAMVIATYGGVAWDEKGVVIMVIPKAAAKQALGLMAMSQQAYTSYDANSAVSGDSILNHLACGMAGWELMATSGLLAPEEMANPICSPTFSLGAFNGTEEEFLNSKELICKKEAREGFTPGYYYSLGEHTWSAPWEVKGLPAWEVPVMEEALAPVESTVRAPLIVD